MSRKRRQKKQGKAYKQVDTGYKPTKLQPRTPNQSTYIRAMRNNEITCCFGPAGCGKTHVAIGLAVEMIRAELLEKLVIVRPLVSMGKDMGYLPGDVDAKIGPYVEPCFDELNHYLSYSMIKQWQHEGTIKIAPLSMMRGKTFNNSFVIMDEAQNAEYDEVKTFLTRIGEPVRAVLTGDITQSDLPITDRGAFEEASKLLKGMESFKTVQLGPEDIVRNRLIGEITRRLW